VKWWEQTVSDRILPATTTLEFIDENDMRDQKAKAEVQKLRADTRKVQIDSGEISPAMARQLAVDSDDLPRELVRDVTTSGQLSDDEKVLPDTPSTNSDLQALLHSAPTSPPQPPHVTTKDTASDLLDEELAMAMRLSTEARRA
jgi:hypothetical protein